MPIMVDLIMNALQCNMMTWQILVTITPEVLQRATASDRHWDTCCLLGAWPDAPVTRGTGRAGPWPFTRASLPVVGTDRTRRSTLDRVRLEFFRDKHSGLSPPFLASSVMENRHFISSKMPESQTLLYCSNTTAFTNVLTPPCVYHHVHMC
jgi:hypothetical protein